MTLEAIGEEVGVSKQRVLQLLQHPPVERWPEDILAAMEEALRAGKTPQDLLAVPGVAERITAKRPGRVSKDEADAEQDKRRLSSLRKLICVGKDQQAGSPGRRALRGPAGGAGRPRSRAGPRDVFKLTEQALRGGSKYAEVLAAVPQLGALLGEDETRAATMLRVLVESGRGAAQGHPRPAAVRRAPGLSYSATSSRTRSTELADIASLVICWGGSAGGAPGLRDQIERRQCGRDGRLNRGERCGAKDPRSGPSRAR
jgi:hypothetical protein